MPITIRRRWSLFFCLFFLLAGASHAEPLWEQPAVKGFIHEMVDKHQFEAEKLTQLFQRAEIKETILKAISAPAEAKPWYRYRQLFLTENRINGGIKFWQENEDLLRAVEKKYGVPAEIIVAIIGVETGYGSYTGSYRVIDALSTLAFAYPARSRYFRQELEQFLLLCREEGLDPAAPKGSYAGAMGWPQFMPSSFRHYAVDFDGDERRNIWTNPADIIASVANYFAHHGWQAGQSVILPAKVEGKAFQNLLDKDLKPKRTFTELEMLGITTPGSVPTDTKVTLVELENEEGPTYWLSLHNFYVITRYNRSVHYAMAVYQLGQKVLARREIQARS